MVLLSLFIYQRLRTAFALIRVLGIVILGLSYSEPSQTSPKLVWWHTLTLQMNRNVARMGPPRTCCLMQSCPNHLLQILSKEAWNHFLASFDQINAREKEATWYASALCAPTHYLLQPICKKTDRIPSASLGEGLLARDVPAAAVKRYHHILIF